MKYLPVWLRYIDLYYIFQISDLMYLLTYIQFISFSRSIDEVLIDIMIYVLFFILGIVISELTKLEKLFNTLK